MNDAAPARAATGEAYLIDEPAALGRLAGHFRRHRRWYVLTGAGISTASGIPDYRDLQGAWKRRQPVTGQAFVGNETTRKRYWARSMIGWPRLDGALPNHAHAALARISRSGRMASLVTQNVDGLLQRAGAHGVIDLHGRIDAIVCLSCGARSSRASLQQRLTATNPAWAERARASAILQAPDGDADLESESFEHFQVPACLACGGLLKPDVVFFGENVPRDRVDAAMAALGQADAMLVAGSSLMVFSGFRFAREAARRGLPVVAINLGRTRADDLLADKIPLACETALPALARALGA